MTIYIVEEHIAYSVDGAALNSSMVDGAALKSSKFRCTFC